MVGISILLCSLLGLLSVKAYPDVSDLFVEVEGNNFILNGEKYFFLGTNYWYGMNLGAPQSGDLSRLQSELDDLKALGIRNLRIMGSTQGPDNRSRRIVPSLEPEKGKYNNDIWEGLDTFLNEMRKRNMKAVVTLNNFWEWSGGFGQLREWNGLNRFDSYPNGFYGDNESVQYYLDFVALIIERRNSVNGLKYNEDATIMSWQLANEPRAGNCQVWKDWVNKTSTMIKALAPKQLVSIGNEGSITSCSSDGNSVKNIDYITFHAWAQNWGWYSPRSTGGLDRAISSAKGYIQGNISMNKHFNKPMVLEEFGLARDNGSYDPSSSTEIRDKYYAAIFEEIYTVAKSI